MRKFHRLRDVSWREQEATRLLPLGHGQPRYARVARSIEPKKEKLKEAEARRYGKTMGKQMVSW